MSFNRPAPVAIPGDARFSSTWGLLFDLYSNRGTHS